MNRAHWYRFDNAAANSRVLDIQILDFIGGWGDDLFDEQAITAKTFVAELAKIQDTVKTIRLHVNSPGGDVFSAVNIANALRDQRVSHGRTVEVIVEGLAASAASIVLMAGNTIKIADNALIMIHNPMTFSAGDAKDMRSTAEELDKVRSIIINTYRWKSPLSEAKLGELMDATTWMDADEALINGFATDKIKGLKAAASFGPDVLNKLGMPDRYRDRFVTHTEQRPAASGTGRVLALRPIAPGVSGLSRVVNTALQDRNMKTFQERMQSWQDSLAGKQAEMAAIQDKVDAEGRGKDDAERERFDTLKIEIENVNKELADLRDMERLSVASAKPVAGTTREDGTRTRGGHIVSVTSNLPPGIEFARMVLCKLASFSEMNKGNFVTAAEIARKRYPDNARIHQILNAAVGAGVTEQAGSPETGFASALVYQNNLASEFVEFLRPQTIIGRIQGLRRVPFNIRVLGQTSGGSGYWVNEGAAKPLTSFSVTPTTLLWAKIAAISVITEELARFSSPSAEAMVRDTLAAAIIERMDIDFIDPNKAAGANGVSPASITNGITPIGSSGTEASSVRTDLAALFAAFIADNMNPATATLIMPTATAMVLSLMQNALGQAQFPGITMQGGTLMGVPVVTSQYVTDGSPGGAIIILVNASDIFLADDGQVTVDVSREASLEMSDAPANNSATGQGAQLVSMFQTNSIALRAERFVNWARRREEAVQYLSDVAYSATGSPS